MTTAQAIEYGITRRLLGRNPGLEGSAGEVSPQASYRWTDRLIAVLAFTVSLFVVGAFLEELLWVVIAAVTVFALGSNSDDV